MTMRRTLSLLALCLLLPAAAFAQTKSVAFTIPRAGFYSIVLDDADSVRVRNLVNGAWYAAGSYSISWDMLDEGTPDYDGDTDGHYVFTRAQVAAGTYTIKAVRTDSVKMRWQGTANTYGSPGWLNAAGTGGGIADNSPPMAAYYLAGSASDARNVWSTDPVVIVTAPSAEAGVNWMVLNAATDAKIAQGPGENQGPAALAVDVGGNRDTGVALYGLYVQKKDSNNLDLWKTNIFEINTDGTQTRRIFNDSVVNDDTNDPGVPGDERTPDSLSSAQRHTGNNRSLYALAVHNKRYIVALNDSVYCYTAARSVTGPAAALSLTGLWWQAGKAYVTNEAGELARYDLNPATCSFTNKATLASGLDAPSDLARWGDTLYVSLWGSSNRVAVYDTTGTLIRTIGTANSLQLGLYDEEKMHQPGQVAVGSSKVWVPESDNSPKRVSRWNLAGAFQRGYYLHGRYSPGLYLDPSDSTKAWYAGPNGTMFVPVSWRAAAGEDPPIAIVSEINRDSYPAYFDEPPVYPIVLGGYTYLVTTMSNNTDGHLQKTVWWLYDSVTGLAKPVAEAGTNWGTPSTVDAALSCMGDNPVHVWSDEDGDGVIDASGPDEVDCALTGSAKAQYANVASDGAWITSTGFYIAPPSVGVGGALTMPTSGTRLESVSDLSQGDVALGTGATAQGRWRVYTRGPWYGYKDSALQWTINVSHPEGDANSLPPRFEGHSVMGQMLDGPVRITGSDGETFDLLVQNTDRGAILLFTADGYMLRELFRDTRVASPLAYAAVPSDSIIGLSPRLTAKGEHWRGTLNETDGSVYLIMGKEGSYILRLDDIESIERLTLGTVTVSAGDLAAAATSETVDWGDFVQAEWPALVSTALPLVDGLSEAPDSTMIDVESVDGSAGWLIFTADTLYAGIQVDTASVSIRVSEACTTTQLFMCGGMDITMMSGTVEERFIIAPRNASHVAMRFVEQDGGALGGGTSPQTYTTEAEGSYTVEDVRAITGTRMVGSASGWEVAIPRSQMLGTYTAGSTYRIDLGYIVTLGGTDASRRTYASNKIYTITDDERMESEVIDSTRGFVTLRTGNVSLGVSGFTRVALTNAAGTVRYENAAVDTLALEAVEGLGLYRGTSSDILLALYAASGTDTTATGVEPLATGSAMATCGIYVGQTGESAREAFAVIGRARWGDVYAVARATDGARADPAGAASVGSGTPVELRAIANDGANTVTLQYSTDEGENWTTLATPALTLSGGYAMGFFGASAPGVGGDGKCFFTAPDVP
jgi:hypothetical protein